MKKHFLTLFSISLSVSLVSSTLGYASNEHNLTHNQIVELVNHINNELSAKDIPALKDKVIVLDIEGNVILEEALSEFEEKTSTSEEKKLLRKSAFLMEYAGDSYYILER